MYDHQALYETMRRAAADAQDATIRARKTIGYASGGLAIILAVTFVLLNVGPQLLRSPMPAAQAASHPQVIVAPLAAPITSIDSKVTATLKAPTDGQRGASAKHSRYHDGADEESSAN
jgi:hypothetical protein